MNVNRMFDQVSEQLTALETELQAVTNSEAKFIKDIGQHLVQAGGKRLRPALYFLCTRSGPGSKMAVMPMAAAIELIHMATLVHDDVIDNATTRRGRPTANARWGNHASVLTGDYLFSKSFSLIACEYDQRLLKVLTDVICSMCEGEIIQHQESFDAAQREAEYYIRIAKKTADFIAASCELGALVAGLKAEEVDGLRRYGYAIGMAFQVTDDILDVTATSEQIGKPAGNDLRQGIVTLPVIHALRHSADREELKAIVGMREMSDEAVRRGLEIIHATDAVAASYQVVDDFLVQAKAAIPGAVPEEVRASLEAIADFIAMREF